MKALPSRAHHAYGRRTSMLALSHLRHLMADYDEPVTLLTRSFRKPPFYKSMFFHVIINTCQIAIFRPAFYKIIQFAFDSNLQNTDLGPAT